MTDSKKVKAKAVKAKAIDDFLEGGEVIPDSKEMRWLKTLIDCQTDLCELPNKFKHPVIDKIFHKIAEVTGDLRVMPDTSLEDFKRKEAKMAKSKNVKEFTLLTIPKDRLSLTNMPSDYFRLNIKGLDLKGIDRIDVKFDDLRVVEQEFEDLCKGKPIKNKWQEEKRFFFRCFKCGTKVISPNRFENTKCPNCSKEMVETKDGKIIKKTTVEVKDKLKALESRSRKRVKYTFGLDCGCPLDDVIIVCIR